MSLRTFCLVGACTAIVAGVSGSASAATFSFASDNDNNAWTFLGSAGAAGAFTLTDGGSTRLPLELFIGAPGQPTIALNTEFDFSASLHFQGDLDFGGGLFLHTYRGAGTFDFYQPGTNNLILSCAIGANSAVMSLTGGADNWSSGGGFFGSDAGGSVTYQGSTFLVNAIIAAGQIPASYGIANGPSTGPDDFSFTLTNINVNLVPGVTIVPGLPSGGNPNGRLPTTSFRSEGSYSGTTGPFIPAPSSIALSAVALLLVARRRR